ncbi:MAG: hypothetical protein AAFO95_14230 [Cyanobacteria bacterium J06600_6]
MNELDLDSFEFSIASDIKAIKPKAKRKGYAREIVEKLHPIIELSLSKGCSYEQIAEVLASRNIKITARTLKRYHKSNSKSENKTIQQLNGSSKKNHKVKTTEGITSDRSQSGREDSTVVSTSSQKQEPSKVRVQNNQIPVSDILSGSALTEEDYADDFNDY